MAWFWLHVKEGLSREDRWYLTVLAGGVKGFLVETLRKRGGVVGENKKGCSLSIDGKEQPFDLALKKSARWPLFRTRAQCIQER